MARYMMPITNSQRSVYVLTTYCRSTNTTAPSIGPNNVPAAPTSSRPSSRALRERQRDHQVVAARGPQREQIEKRGRNDRCCDARRRREREGNMQAQGKNRRRVGREPEIGRVAERGQAGIAQ